MQEKIKHIKVNEIEYPLVFNLNVMEKIQDKYETVENWGDLTDGKEKEDGTKQEINIKALKIWNYRNDKRRNRHRKRNPRNQKRIFNR